MIIHICGMERSIEIGTVVYWASFVLLWKYQYFAGRLLNISYGQWTLILQE